MPESCDIFCNVIDNYGDIGVCWRLARQLANEYGLQVRLWLDDMPSLAKLCPEIDVAAEKQRCRSVEVCHWTADAFPSCDGGRGWGRERGVAELVIEAFACKLPQNYIEAMAEQESKPVWINLEYLSAEDWVQGCHKLPSPHPTLPLTKYFFFPGFTPKTGGLLLERNLLARRDAFQGDAAQRQAFWQSVGIEMPSAQTLKVSLFAYENAALNGLFDAWADGAQPLLCLVPESRILPQVGQYFGDAEPCAGKAYTRGTLQVCVLQFVEQERYDELLWACDVNVVRGEDSFVRAQWAGRPLVWQIYPQHDAVHLKKLQAFLTLHGSQLSQSAKSAVAGLWQAWNGGCWAVDTWSAFVAARGELDSHARQWARQLAENNLALNLLDFCQEIGRMRALENEGQ
ncbi:MAG: elongation factor P maturation arginine rhamnosyltransferase EarP [Nitrosomonadales bacterium]|nr:elongation factor P maturation arginine rhamnosyltransferase EarP [Nitrosomonadales bacterium]